MKQIPFNEKKILKALLEKTKVTTLRKAWHGKSQIHKPIHGTPYMANWNKALEYGTGDIVEIVWTGGSICKSCFKTTKTDKKMNEYCLDCETMISQLLLNASTNVFEAAESEGFILPNTSLGKVKIKSIEKIRIGYIKSSREFIIWREKDKIKGTDKYSKFDHPDEEKELSKSEGFESVKQMFEWLEKYAEGLETPKPFYLISWEWLK